MIYTRKPRRGAVLLLAALVLSGAAVFLLSACAYPDTSLDTLGALRSPCDSPLATDVLWQGNAVSCAFTDGPRTITVRDGVPMTGYYGWATRWGSKRCLIELAYHRRPGTWKHELKHCREGSFHT